MVNFNVHTKKYFPQISQISAENQRKSAKSAGNINNTITVKELTRQMKFFDLN